MTRNQNLAVSFLLIILIATMMLIAYVATVHAAPDATPYRPPRATATAQADTGTDDAPSRPRIVPTGRPCENNRWTTPRNCSPDRRPLDRRVPR